MYKIRLKIVHIQIVGNPMGTNCARRVVADLPLFCYERDFMLSLFDNNILNKWKIRYILLNSSKGKFFRY